MNQQAPFGGDGQADFSSIDTSIITDKHTNVYVKNKLVHAAKRKNNVLTYFVDMCLNDLDDDGITGDHTIVIGSTMNRVTFKKVTVIGSVLNGCIIKDSIAKACASKIVSCNVTGKSHAYGCVIIATDMKFHMLAYSHVVDSTITLIPGVMSNSKLERTTVANLKKSLGKCELISCKHV